MNTCVRGLALCAFVIVLTGQAPPLSEDQSADFCTRLGKSIGIEKVTVTDGKAGWTANALNFGQRVLFGGTASTSVAVEPIEPAAVEDYKRAADMCITEAGGAVCRLVGPMNFEFGWKGNKSVTPIALGDEAVVTVTGMKTSCQSGLSRPAG